MRIIVSCGDPNGIGLEVFFKALERYEDGEELALVVSRKALESYAMQMKAPVEIGKDWAQVFGKTIELIPTASECEVNFGSIGRDSGAVAAEAVEIAVAETLAGKAQAIATMPISKEAVYAAGWKFPGHTEMLAARCKVDNPLMILFAGSLRVALVTAHTPLRCVPFEVTKRAVIDKAEAFALSLKRDFGAELPKIAVLSLNPHAGEGGAIGGEERETIAPAIEKLKQRGIDARGPIPSDGFFAFGDWKNYDGVLAMYHDQGLIPLKLLAGGAGVNFTANLPIVRTSPDHGTAFAIAGKGAAGPESALDALSYAKIIFENRKKYDNGLRRI